MQTETTTTTPAPKPDAQPVTAAHTPGPWRLGDAGKTIFGPKTDQPAPAIIAEAVASTRVSAEERRANARLIASAPALLANLQRLADAVAAHRESLTIAALNELCEAEDDARAALQMARGAK